MEFQTDMPMWAIIYSIFIFVNGVATVIVSKNKSLIYAISQLLATAFMISFLFVYYQQVEKPESFVIVLMVGFILYQEVVVNREIYEDLVFSQLEGEAKGFKIGLFIFMALFLMPIFYIIASLI
jgi:hypothetical protein